MEKAVIKHVVKTEIGGKKYIGTFNGKTFTGVSLLSNDLSKEFSNFLKAGALGELQTIIVGSKNTLIVMPLSNAEVLDFERIHSLWTLAQSTALAHAAIWSFDRLLGN